MKNDCNASDYKRLTSIGITNKTDMMYRMDMMIIFDIIFNKCSFLKRESARLSYRLQETTAQQKHAPISVSAG